MSESPAKGAKGEKFLKKAEREVCWKARDEFWKCMTANNEQMDSCKITRKAFQVQCPATWVAHFDRKFQYEKFKAEANAMGYQKLDENFTKKNKQKQ
jgi:cytochrome c oxidase assembly factor 6